MMNGRHLVVPVNAAQRQPADLPLGIGTIGESRQESECGFAHHSGMIIGMLRATVEIRRLHSLSSVRGKRAMKMPRLIRESGRFDLSFPFKPISLQLSLSPTERVVLPQSSYGHWQTMFVS